MAAFRKQRHYSFEPPAPSRAIGGGAADRTRRSGHIGLPGIEFPRQLISGAAEDFPASLAAARKIARRAAIERQRGGIEMKRSCDGQIMTDFELKRRLALVSKMPDRLLYSARPIKCSFDGL